MKDFIILTNSGGTLFSGTDILHVLQTFRIISDEEIIGIVDYRALLETSEYDFLTAHIGLS